MPAANPRIEIVLPEKIGDAILSLPALVCLQNLKDHQEVVIYPPDRLFEIFWSFKVHETKYLEEIGKVHSWFDPPDKLIFLNKDARAFGLRGKQSYGLKQPKAWYKKYDFDLPFLELAATEKHLSKELLAFLRNSGLSLGAIRYFGILTELGYSAEQIQKAFQFNRNSLALQNELNYWKPELSEGGYLVYCAEADYGSKAASERRWNDDNFIGLAEELHKTHKLVPVFVGTENKPRLPKNFLDLRGRLTLLQVAQLMKFAKGFIGNDSGNLHLANLMKTPTLGIYLSTNPADYAPIFRDWHFCVSNPQSVEEVLEESHNLLAYKRP